MLIISILWRDCAPSKAPRWPETILSTARLEAFQTYNWRIELFARDHLHFSGIEGYNCARRSIWMARSIRIAPKAIAGPVSSRRCRGQIRHPKSIAKLSGHRSSRVMRSSDVAAIRGADVAYRNHNEQEADGRQDSLLRRRLHHGFVCRQGVRPRIERPPCYARACRMCHGFGSKTGALQQK
jgi:hypothetical protein